MYIVRQRKGANFLSCASLLILNSFFMPHGVHVYITTFRLRGARVTGTNGSRDLDDVAKWRSHIATKAELIGAASHGGCVDICRFPVGAKQSQKPRPVHFRSHDVREWQQHAMSIRPVKSKSRVSK